MASRTELHQHYPVPCEQLLATFTDPQYLRARLAAVGGPNDDLVSRQERDREVTVVLHQAVPGTSLPGFVRALVDGDLAIRRTETWTDTGAQVQAEVAGAPGTISGELLFRPDADECGLAVRLQTTVPVPLVGGKAERLVADALTRLLTAEHQFTLRWLECSATR